MIKKFTKVATHVVDKAIANTQGDPIPEKFRNNLIDYGASCMVFGAKRMRPKYIATGILIGVAAPKVVKFFKKNVITIEIDPKEPK